MTRRPDVIGDDELRARAAELAMVPPVEVERREENAVLIVTAGERRCGVALASVREVVSRPIVTPLPLTPPVVAGVINLRGDILPALDLSRLLASTAGQHRFAVVVRHDDLSAALLVDDVEDMELRAGISVTTINVSEVLFDPALQPFRDTASR